MRTATAASRPPLVDLAPARGLSLWQPWAQLVAIGAKRVETRGWYTSYRGPLLIHAAREWSIELARTCLRPEFAAALWPEGRPRRAPELLPRGRVVAVVRLASVFRFDGHTAEAVGPREAAFGDFAPGRFGFRLADVVELPEPVPMRGRQGLWTPTAAEYSAILRALPGGVLPEASGSSCRRQQRLF